MQFVPRSHTERASRDFGGAGLGARAQPSGGADRSQPGRALTVRPATSPHLTRSPVREESFAFLCHSFAEQGNENVDRRPKYLGMSFVLESTDSCTNRFVSTDDCWPREASSHSN
ncbi:unnamed protein product [Leptosia nina]|uniref:Uncharacterized protein n=1 Tax=Leptosia nina TaxID=320188 RepID=A0AAV1IUL6_9NEOP